MNTPAVGGQERRPEQELGLRLGCGWGHSLGLGLGLGLGLVRVRVRIGSQSLATGQFGRDALGDGVRWPRGAKCTHIIVQIIVCSDGVAMVWLWQVRVTATHGPY